MPEPETSSEQDWRLQAALDVADPRRSLRDLVGRFRGPARVRDLEAAVPRDVVITHDGSELFAYASDRATLDAARRGIEDVLRDEQVKASVRVSHWDDAVDEWRQIDPLVRRTPAEDAAERDALAVTTRTLVVSAGKLIRAEFERSTLAWAAELGVECETIEHPHLLTTQVGFTVTGPKRKVEEFAQGLAAEERATIRAERAVMMSPL